MTIEKNFSDWEWVNKLPSLAICDAVALSLGYGFDALPIVRYCFQGMPSPEYGERAALTYEYARAGKLRLTGMTSATGDIFDPKANFADGQLWEIDLLEFRQLCDTMMWVVPDGFSLIGYKAVKAPDTDASIQNGTDEPPAHARQDARLARLNELGGDLVWKSGKWQTTGHGAQAKLVVELNKTKSKPFSEKSIRKDLQEAAKRRQSASIFGGLGSR